MNQYACEPADIDTRALVLTGTFGRAEREAAAWMVVRLYQVRGRPWSECFRLPEFAELLEQDEPTRRRCSNPFFRMDFQSLVADRLLVELTPGTPADGVRVSPEFVARCAAGPCGPKPAEVPDAG